MSVRLRFVTEKLGNGALGGAAELGEFFVRQWGMGLARTSIARQPAPHFRKCLVQYWILVTFGDQWFDGLANPRDQPFHNGQSLDILLIQALLIIIVKEPGIHHKPGRIHAWRAELVRQGKLDFINKVI